MVALYYLLLFNFIEFHALPVFACWWYSSWSCPARGLQFLMVLVQMFICHSHNIFCTAPLTLISLWHIDHFCLLSNPLSIRVIPSNLLSISLCGTLNLFSNEWLRCKHDVANSALLVRLAWHVWCHHCKAYTEANAWNVSRISSSWSRNYKQYIESAGVRRGSSKKSLFLKCSI